MDFLNDSDELNEIYRLYGIAAHNCSNIEYRIAYLLLGPKWALIENIDPEKVSAAYDDLYSKPLGALLKHYKQHFDFTEETIEQMKLVLDKRNHLVHRLFGSYGKKMHDKEVLAQMKEELLDLIDIFQRASHSLDPDRWK